MTEIKVKIGSQKDFEELAKLDYTNTYDKMFVFYTKKEIFQFLKLIYQNQ